MNRSSAGVSTEICPTAGSNDSFFCRRTDVRPMSPLFGPSEQDLHRLRTTVRSLGVASVPGLAAALDWRPRKAEKLLAHELSRPGTPLVYEPARRTVRWATVPPAPGQPPPSAEPAAARTAPTIVVPSRVPRAPAPVLTSAGLKTLCPHCHVPLLATGATNLAVCPECGRLASPRPATPSPSNGTAAPRPSPAPPVSAPARRGSDGGLADRRSQELFAAYVSSKPIPCPKCRTPLRHRSLSEYTCPSCGELVRFPTAATSGAALSPLSSAPRA